MGQEIVYCSECQVRLMGADFDKGRAFRVEHKNLCADCARKILGSLPEAAPPAKTSSQHIPIQRSTTESGSHARLRALGDSTAARSFQPVAAPKPSPLPWLLGGVGALILVALIGALASSGGRTPAPPPPNPVDPRPQPPPESAAREREAKIVLDAALAWTTAHPGELDAHMDRLQKALFQAEGTSLADRAKGELEAARVRNHQLLTREIAALKQEARPLLEQGNMDGARLLVDARRGRFKARDWEIAVRDLLEAAARPKPPPDPWRILDLENLISEGGATFRKRDDRAVVVGGPNPPRDTFKASARAGLKGVRAFRLEALPDPSLPAGGPGRPANGNIVLGEFKVQAGGRALAFSGVSTDHEQLHYPASAAIDGDSLTGWALSGRLGQASTAIFHLQAPADLDAVSISLEHQSAHPSHVLGCFRIAVTAAELQPPPPPRPALAHDLPPVIPPGVLAYRQKWNAAAPLAAAREYGPALKALEAAAPDESARSEADADLADLKLVAALVEELRPLLAKWPRGWAVAAEFLDENGDRRRLEEPVRRADAGRLEFFDGRSLEHGEILAASLADLFLARGKKVAMDARAAGLLCAFEGDLDAARRHLGGNVPDKLAVRAGALPNPKADPEADARRRLHEVERELRAPLTRTRALEKLASLLAERGDTLVVRRSRASLAARAESSKDAFFAPADLKASGLFALQRHPKGEIAWTMTEEVADKALRKEHVLEVEYSAPPGAEVRGWALAGGCCVETFTFLLQGTDVEGPDADNPANAVKGEIGGAFFVAVPPAGVAFLKKTHAAHGGPRTAARFEWIPLPLFKHAGPGTQAKLRLHSTQQGFAVAALLLSTSRKQPPKDAEAVELLASRPFAEPDAGPAWQTGSILREVWTGIGGDKIEDLTNNPAYKGVPNAVERPTSFESPKDYADSYGSRFRGWLVPPVSGPYVFCLTSDDHAEVFVSTDDGPAARVKLLGNGNARPWDQFEILPPSGPVQLVRGRRYYVEAFHKEGGGGDHFRLGWKLPDGRPEFPIPGHRLIPWSPNALSRSGAAILSPTPGSAIPAGQPLPIQAESPGSVRIDIFQGAVRIGEAKGTPAVFTWAQPPAGAHLLSARAADKAGKITASKPLGVVVGDVHFYRGIDLGGADLDIEDRAWKGRGAPGVAVTGQGFERPDLELRPPADAARARMIRTSVAAREGTRVAFTELPAGKFLVYLTVWEPGETPQAFDLSVNGKSVETGRKAAAQGDWTRLGPWPAEPAAGKIEIAAARGLAHFSGVELWSLGAIAPTKREKSALGGGRGGTYFEENPPGNPFLAGLRLTQRDGRLQSLQGVYRAGEKTVDGDVHGSPIGGVTEILAKPGYAVGGIRVRGSDRVQALQVVFMKISGAVLQPADRYESGWYVGDERDTVLLGGDGAPVVGLYGQRGSDADGVGLILFR